MRVQSGGAAGAVALYVFSTDTGKKGSGLKVVFRSQELLRAETRIRDGVLRYRTARRAPGDELCCPSALAESRLRWRDAQAPVHGRRAARGQPRRPLGRSSSRGVSSTSRSTVAARRR